jgi:uncharacterized protein YecE (DUF72 family)
MKFGKVDNIEIVDFTLPPEPDKNSSICNKTRHKTNLYLGATGWSMPEWKGLIYPEKAKTKEFLYHYSRQFNTIELNSTHYRLPTSKTIAGWIEDTPADFTFCPKVPQNISHRKDLGLGTGAIDEFLDRISLFQNKLGPCFMQLPPYFTCDRIDQLSKFLERIPFDFDFALEVRNESFFQENTSESFINLLKEQQIILVITDVAGRRDLLHTTLTAPKAFIRWVGNGLHPSDYSRLNDWKQRILLWAQYGIPEIYFFPHEPDNLLTPQISSYFYHSLSAGGHFNGRAPHIFQQNDQLKLF